MTISTPELIGAAIGLALALVAYVTIAGLWKRRTTDTSVDAAERARFEQTWPIMRVILLADFLILAALGYYVGQLFAV
jgi:hypothetical protein